MKKKMLLIAVSLVLLMGLQACSTTSTTSTSRQALSYPPKLEAAIKDTGAKIVILVTEKGELSFYDAEGESLKPCSLPDSDSNDPVCKGVQGDQAIIGINALPILKTKGSGCITIGPNASGQYYQYCW
jgi:hypothetical protein